MSTLLSAGFTVESLGNENIRQAIAYLEENLCAQEGLLGFG